MSCSAVRRRLTRSAAAAGEPAVARHLEGCPACARYASRLAAARQALARHRTEVEPGPAFAARVTARIAAPPDALGWAALRLLPATLALALALAGWCLVGTPSPGELLAGGAPQDLLGWMVTAAEEGP